MCIFLPNVCRIYRHSRCDLLQIFYNRIFEVWTSVLVNAEYPLFILAGKDIFITDYVQLQKNSLHWESS